MSFLPLWNVVAYLWPGLHPDSFDEAGGGWPRALVPIAAEAWARYEAGQLSADELYPSDAAWAGLCDRLDHLTAEERLRRETLRR